MTPQNSTKILDAICERQNMLKQINTKAKTCVELNLNIKQTMVETYKVFEAVFKNFSPDRKPLGIFIYSERYGSNKGKPAKWLDNKEDIKESDRYYYQELCLHNTGFSLLSTWGGNSQTIMVPNDTEKTMFYLKALKEDIPQKKLKEVLKPEKLELLNKVLNGLEEIIYNSELWLALKLNFSKTIIGYGKCEITKCKTDFISLNADRSWFYAKFCRKDHDGNYDQMINLSNLDMDMMVIVEQIEEEINFALDKYIDYLNKNKEDVTKYYEKVKDRFVKELICLNLKGKI